VNADGGDRCPRAYARPFGIHPSQADAERTASGTCMYNSITATQQPLFSLSELYVPSTSCYCISVLQVVVRAEEICISGGLVRQKMKYERFLRKRMNTQPSHGPIHFRAPSKILWRTIRGSALCSAACVTPPLCQLVNSNCSFLPAVWYHTRPREAQLL